MLSERQDQGLASRQGHVAREVDGGARRHVLGRGMAANDLGIATHVELIVRAAPVEDRHHSLALPLTAEDIDALVGDELLLRALRDGLAALTPMEHAAQPGEHPLLGIIAARGREAVVGVAREAAREVATHIAVRHLLGAVEEHLRAIVELRDAVHRQQQGERLLEGRGVASLAQEAVGIVVFDEGEHARRIGVEIVVAEDVVDAVEALPPVVGLLVASQREAVEEGEVHDRLEITVLRAEARVFLPGRGIGRLRHPGLAHTIEVGILRVDGLHPGRHGLAVGIGIGVHADAVDGGRLDPPDTVLDEVAHDVGVALVEVGHGGDKPSVGSLLAVDVGGVGVEDGRELIAGLEAIAGMVEPVAGRAVLLPGMVTAAMVEDHVHDDLQSALVAVADQGAIVGIGAKARIPKEFIGAVIGPGGKIIQQMQEDTGATITIEETDGKGHVQVSAPNKDSIDAALAKIKAIVAVPEVGEVYEGTVRSIMPYGCFVEILPGKDGLLHISEIDWKRLETVAEAGIKEGDKIKVKLMEIDPKTGKYKLSHRVLMEKPEGYVERERRPRPERGERRGRRDDRHEGRGERPARQPRRYEHRNEEQAPKDFNDSLDHNNDVE